MTTTTEALRNRTWQGPGLLNSPFRGGRKTDGDAYKLVSTDAKSGWNRPTPQGDRGALHKGGTDWKFKAKLDDDGVEIARELNARLHLTS